VFDYPRDIFMAYDLTGKIKLIQDPKSFGSGFNKREMVVIVEDGKYPQEINIEFVQEKVALLDTLQPGEEVTISFDIRGREYNGRYFNNLQGWKIVTRGSEPTPSGEDSSSEPYYPTPSDFEEPPF
jgi:single-strand DNA-binding protein